MGDKNAPGLEPVAKAPLTPPPHPTYSLKNIFCAAPFLRLMTISSWIWLRSWVICVVGGRERVYVCVCVCVGGGGRL